MLEISVKDFVHAAAVRVVKVPHVVKETVKPIGIIGIEYLVVIEAVLTTRIHMKIPPIPECIGDALDIEDACRSTLAEWYSISPADRAQRVLDTPNLKQYIDYCRTVIQGIDTWKKHNIKV